MTSGAKVRVYPHGSPKQAAVGTIAIRSDSDLAVGISFDTAPPFVVVRPISKLFPEHGDVMFYASRMLLNGAPWGPWVELIGGGHYEIEELEESENADGSL